MAPLISPPINHYLVIAASKSILSFIYCCVHTTFIHTNNQVSNEIGYTADLNKHKVKEDQCKVVCQVKY